MGRSGGPEELGFDKACCQTMKSRVRDRLASVKPWYQSWALAMMAFSSW